MARSIHLRGEHLNWFSLLAVFAFFRTINVAHLGLDSILVEELKPGNLYLGEPVRLTFDFRKLCLFIRPNYQVRHAMIPVLVVLAVVVENLGDGGSAQGLGDLC